MFLLNRKAKISNKSVVLVLDLDGVLTDGKIYQSSTAKLFKVFGPDDHDALILAKNYMEVVVVSADKDGELLVKSRVTDKMGLEFFIVSAFDRAEWISRRYLDSFVIYMGDGFYDHVVFKSVDYGIAPSNGAKRTKSTADFVTKSRGSERAVAEAVLHILHRFFGVKI